MNEDERYRTSTQYRLWSYSPESLATLRETTNQNAAERVREAMKRVAASKASSTTQSAEASEAEQNGTPVPMNIDGEIDCLTAEEELKLLAFYCRQTIDLGNHMKVPTEVKATAIQYIRRFYVTNSLMTYHPRDILKTALFFATKTENHYIRLTKFASELPKTKPEDILASEFLLTQGLRFTFDVRHPYRALEGAAMELQALASGHIPAIPGHPVPKFEGDLARRAKDAHGKAREYLKTSALLTDVYFHYTPSQIMMASLFIADFELTTWYIGVKFPGDEGSAAEALRDKVMMTLEDCANMLKSVSPSGSVGEAELKELKAYNKKLAKCRNPEKVDLVSINERVKRDNMEGGNLDENVAKKRRLEREASEKEGQDLFGPEIKKA